VVTRTEDCGKSGSGKARCWASSSRMAWRSASPSRSHTHRCSKSSGWRGAETCLLLVERLVRLVGDRDVSVWCPVARPDVRQILEGMGFARLLRDAFLGRPSYLYRWEREDD
jgi:hypothetical protein